MSHGKLRSDSECENCGYDQVIMAYCPKCGQHNIETRQSFGHLVTHFAEDFTHYDSGFWKTIKYLLFRPAKLTKEYLIGKRQEYVPPVKLYIFLSFVAFLLPVLLPDFRGYEEAKKAQVEDLFDPVFPKGEPIAIIDNSKINSLEELDKFKASGKIGWFYYKVNKSGFFMREHATSMYDILKYAGKLLPKVLFFYMPVFAFWLWLFHGKKRWYFFDHGIFTLHYFSFLLLLYTLVKIISWLINQSTGLNFTAPAFLILSLYPFFYFFRSHRRMYGETRLISRFKSLLLFFINSISILIVLIIVGFYTFLTYH